MRLRCDIVPANCVLHSICLPHTQVIAMSSSVSTVVEVCYMHKIHAHKIWSNDVITIYLLKFRPYKVLSS